MWCLDSCSWIRHERYLAGVTVQSFQSFLCMRMIILDTFVTNTLHEDITIMVIWAKMSDVKQKASTFGSVVCASNSIKE